MSYDAKSFTSTLALFYAIGVTLAVRAYAQNSINDFAVVGDLWARATLWLIVFGMGFWFACIVLTAFGHPPRMPLRFLHLCFLLFIMHRLDALMFAPRVAFDDPSRFLPGCRLVKPSGSDDELHTIKSGSARQPYSDCRPS